MWYDKGTILPSNTWQDFPVASHYSVNFAIITFEPFGGDAQIYPEGIRRHCMFRRKWLSPLICTEEAFFLWPQPEPYVGRVTVAKDAANMGFIQYVWQVRLLKSYNEQIYYVNIREQ